MGQKPTYQSYKIHLKQKVLAKDLNTFIQCIQRLLSYTRRNWTNGSPHNKHSTHTQHKCTSQMIINIIENAPAIKLPDRIKIQIPSSKIKTVIQIYYIYKGYLKLAYYSMYWKIAKVMPAGITKPDKPAISITNYKPISLLDNLAKILKKIIHLHLLMHVYSNTIILVAVWL